MKSLSFGCGKEVPRDFLLSTSLIPWNRNMDDIICYDLSHSDGKMDVLCMTLMVHAFLKPFWLLVSYHPYFF